MKNLVFLLLLIASVSVCAQNEVTFSSEIKTLLLYKINAYRKQHRVAPLVLEEGIQKAAQNQCDYLFSVGKLSHTQPNKPYKTNRDRIVVFSKKSFMCYGENCLMTHGDFVSTNPKTHENIAEEMFQIWRKSPPHNANLLLKRFTHADFGFRYNPETEEIYCVIDFGGN